MFIQILWLLWSACHIYWFLNKKDWNLIYFLLLSSIFYWSGFLLLWALEWFFVSFSLIIRNLVALKYRENKNIWYIFITIFTILLLYSIIQNWFIFSLNLLPYISWITGTFGIYFMKWTKTRLLFLLWDTLWVIYGFHVFLIWEIIWSWLACLSNLFFTIKNWKIIKIINE